MTDLVRLNKFISENGNYSRRKADELIKRGDILVNGIKAILGQKINPNQDKVAINGKELKQSKLVYYALNKPKGVITSASDEIGRQTVTDLVPKNPRVFPVGRLDKESQGLIILTNDGDLANQLTHPKFEHEKEYEIQVKNQKSKVKSMEAIINIFTKGLITDGKLMKMDKCRLAGLNANRYMLNAILHTGYNRQIRKMCAKMGLKVLELTRVRIEKLKLSDLNIETGKYLAIKKEMIL